MKNIKKGDIVALVGFTGIRLTDVEVVGATKTQIKALKADGSEMIFSKKDGIQTNVEKGKERYANRIMQLEDAPVNKKRKKQQPKPKKDKVVVEEPEESFDEEFEDEEVEETEVEEVDYSSMTVPQLRKELKKQKIDVPTGSKKADLLALLAGETEDEEEDFDDADDFDAEEDGDEWEEDGDEWEDEFEEI